MKNIKLYVLVIIIVISLTGCNSNKLKKVKSESLDECSEFTIEQLVNYYIKDSEWIVEKSHGSYIYGVGGNGYYNGIPSDILITFEYKNQQVYLDDFEVNGESENKSSSISDMCKTAQLMEKDSDVIQIPVEFIYNKEAYVIESEDDLDNINMKIYGSKKQIEKFKSQENISLTIDLTEYNEIEKEYDVDLSYTNDVYNLLYRFEVPQISVKLKNKISDLKTLSYELTNNESVNVIEVKLQNEEVIVKSSLEKLEEIANVKAVIDLNKYNISLPGTYEIEVENLVAYDSKGTVIKNIEIIPKIISVILVVE